jgi:NhaP-type Na+/H+ or K+/H+ antiporter
MVVSVQVSPSGGAPTDDELNAAAVASNPQAGWRKAPFPSWAGTTGLLCLLFAGLYFLIGDMMLPNKGATIPDGALWSFLLIWVGSVIGGEIAVKCQLPSLLGMLLSGLVLRNLPGNLVEYLPETWSSSIRAAGLSVILMRSGLELDIDAFKKVGWMAARLTVLPGLSEAVVVGIASIFLFKMNAMLGICLGFILAAVSPAVVVLGMFQLQAGGFGVEKGIPSLVVAAASFDDVVAITGYTICKSIALSASGGVSAWAILHGPVDVVAGVSAGCLGGLICGCTAIWGKKWQRSSAVFGMGLTLMFLGRKYGFNGGGAMASLVLGIAANKCWTNGKPMDGLSIGPLPHAAHTVESDLARAWKIVFQPLLFGVIGTAVKFASMTPSTIPKSILILVIGLCVRLPMAYASVGGGTLTHKERLFIALSWIPKATVQAALASDPLDYIMKNTPEDAQAVAWGNDILTTAVFAIIFTAPVGMMIINSLGPKWLDKHVEEGEGAVAITPGDGADSSSAHAEALDSHGSLDHHTKTTRGVLDHHLDNIRALTSGAGLPDGHMKAIHEAASGLEAIIDEYVPHAAAPDSAGTFFRKHRGEPAAAARRRNSMAVVSE